MINNIIIIDNKIIKTLHNIYYTHIYIPKIGLK